MCDTVPLAAHVGKYIGCLFIKKADLGELAVKLVWNFGDISNRLSELFLWLGSWNMGGAW